MDRCPTGCVAEIELQIQPSDSSDSTVENESEQVIYFTWKKVDKRVTKAQHMVSFDDAVCTIKSQIKVFKNYIFVKRLQNDAHDKHKAELSDVHLLVYVDIAQSYIEMISKIKSKGPTLEIKAFRSLHRVVILKVQQAR